MQVMIYIFINRKSYFDSFKTFEVIDAESPIVIFLGTYGISIYMYLYDLYFLSDWQNV